MSVNSKWGHSWPAPWPLLPIKLIFGASVFFCFLIFAFLCSVEECWTLWWKNLWIPDGSRMLTGKRIKRFGDVTWDFPRPLSLPVTETKINKMAAQWTRDHAPCASPLAAGEQRRSWLVRKESVQATRPASTRRLEHRNGTNRAVLVHLTRLLTSLTWLHTQKGPNKAVKIRNETQAALFDCV